MFKFAYKFGNLVKLFNNIVFGSWSFIVIEKINFDLAAQNHSLCIVNTGGNPEEFIREDDEIEIRFKELYAEYRTRRDQLASEIEQSKENNLKEKLVIIDELKELINSKETVNHTFNQFRELQRRWKEIGAVPQANVKDLWETYHLYVEQFYNYVKINKELKDLDLKKNYEIKYINTIH